LADFLLFPASLDARKIRVNLHVLVDFPYDFSGPIAGVILLAFSWSKIAASKTLESVTGRIF
jgi:hypothetical protein